MPRWGRDRFRAPRATLAAWRAIQQPVPNGLGEVSGAMASWLARSAMVGPRPHLLKGNKSHNAPSPVYRTSEDKNKSTKSITPPSTPPSTNLLRAHGVGETLPGVTARTRDGEGTSVG